MGQQPEDSSLSPDKPPLHLRREQQYAHKNVPCFQQATEAWLFEGGGCNWLQMDSSLFSDCFCVGAFLCHPPQSQPSLLPEGDGSSESSPKAPGACPLTGVSTSGSVSTTRLDFALAPEHLGARKKASKSRLEPVTASPRFPGPRSPLLSIREISQVAEAGGPGLGSHLRPLPTNQPHPPPPKTQ